MTKINGISDETGKTLELFGRQAGDVRSIPLFEDVMKKYRRSLHMKRVSVNQFILAALFLINIISGIAVYNYATEDSSNLQKTLQEEYYLNYTDYYYLI